MNYRSAEALDQRNTLALHSTAAYFVDIEQAQDIAPAYAWARDRGVWVLPLGQGSNSVFADATLDALVMQIAIRGRQCLAENNDIITLRIGAGEDWHSLVCWTVQQGWFGLENLALIPGTVGAAPVQNIGAYGVELDSVVQAVHGVNVDTGTFETLSASQCDFAYRDSIFKRDLRNRFVITAVDITLHKTPAVNISYPALANALDAAGIEKPSPKQVMDTVTAVRRKRLPDPATVPNAGSFFKNPVLDAASAKRLQESDAHLPSYPHGEGQVKLPAAYLIDQCGMKGFSENGVGVHADHALVLVNQGSKSGNALLNLARRIQNTVFERYGVMLEIEPRIYEAGGERV